MWFFRKSIGRLDQKKYVIARVWRAHGLELREIAGILQLFFGVQLKKSTEQWVKTFGSQPGESSCSFQLFDTVIYWIFIRICLIELF